MKENKLFGIKINTFPGMFWFSLNSVEIKNFTFKGTNGFYLAGKNKEQVQINDLEVPEDYILLKIKTEEVIKTY